MSVLNWKNVHFNLIVSQTHMLAQLGSLSFQAANQASLQPPRNQVAKEAVEASQIRATGDPGLKGQGAQETLISFKLKLEQRDAEILKL